MKWVIWIFFFSTLIPERITHFIGVEHIARLQPFIPFGASCPNVCGGSVDGSYPNDFDECMACIDFSQVVSN